MKKGKNIFKMLLQKKKSIIAFFAIALFSVLIIAPMKSDSADFKYSEFDWDTFAEANKEYWDGYCSDELEDDEQEKCHDTILKSQKKFYKKLYKLLAKYEKKDPLLKINDNIILETVFYEMDPSSFSDDGAEYKDDWESPSGVYTIDDADNEDPDIEVNYNDESAAEYYAEEKDTLKTLVQNMIAYGTTCYGVHGDPLYREDDKEKEHPYCENNQLKVDIPVKSGLGYAIKTKCVDRVLTSEKGFYEYYVSKWANDIKLPFRKVIPFLGLIHKDEEYDTCMAQSGDYPEGTNYVYEDIPFLSTDRYFDFLSFNRYFDGKAHLQEHFEETVLKPAGVKCMTNKVCSDSLEAAGKYEEYDAEIILVRREIIYDIIDILNNYLTEDEQISYAAYQTANYIEANGEAATRKGFFWPIGSDETEVRNGITYADKDPASTNVEGYFEERTNPVTGNEEMHYGIDIAGVDGTTNVIAVSQGEVLTVVSNCSSGDYECNEGYGNTIILSHSNGDYTVYAHLASIDSAVTVGTTVQQGQLIGKVGSTGRTKTANLHYELRVGGNDISFSVDPLGVTSPDKPRPQPSQGDFSVHTTSLTREEFISLLRAYCNKNSCNSTMQNVFVARAGDVYDASIANNVNPELVVVRARVEGFSPGGGTNNYWGIRCYNGAGAGACSSYSSLEAGIAGFASVVSKYNTASEMMSKYAYIGKYWFNPGSWSLGGCVYYPYIAEYMSPGRSTVVNGVCNNGPSCENGGGAGCTKTTDEDQQAYATWQVNKKMAPERYNIFGL